MSLKITFINVGYGEAILLEGKNPARPDVPFTMLIDGGSSDPQEYSGCSGRIRALDYLHKAGITKLDIVLNTHIHEDHTCGLEPIIKAIPTAQFWYVALPQCEWRSLPASMAATAANGRFLEALNAAQRVHRFARDNHIVLREMRSNITPLTLCEGVYLDLLGPAAAAADSFVCQLTRLYREQPDEKAQQLLAQLDAQMNNISTVLRIRCHHRAILLVGDTNRDGYPLLTGDSRRLKADLFKLGHHGQQDSITAAVLQAVDPDVAVICASNDFRYNSTNSEILHMLAEHGRRSQKPLTIAATDQTNVPPYLTAVPPHDAVIFTVNESGAMQWRYSMTATV